MHLKGENLANILIVLDVDRYNTGAEKQQQKEKYFTRTGANAAANRTSALTTIRGIQLPPNNPSEQFINNSIRAINDQSEVVIASNSINSVLDKHDYVNKIINQLGYQDRKQGLKAVTDKLKTTPEWNNYIAQVQDWLIERITTLNLN